MTMPNFQPEADSIGLTYQGKPRTWGFRLSKLDMVVLVVTVLLTIGLWKPTEAFSFFGFWVVLHFFLFCNVFRIPRTPELVWGWCFLIMYCGCFVLDFHSPITVCLFTLPFTLLVLGWSIRLPSYHGIMADRINPRLHDYLTGNDPRR